MIVRWIVLFLCVAFPASLHGQTADEYTIGPERHPEFQATDFFADESVDQESVDVLDSAQATVVQNAHPGLLGKSYFRASYMNRDRKSSWYGNSSIHGFSAELNFPIEETQTERFGADYFAHVEHEWLSTSWYDKSGIAMQVGLRSYWLLKNRRLRPYVGIGIGLVGYTEVYQQRRYSKHNVLISPHAGLEFDIASGVSSRHEIRSWLTSGGATSSGYDGSLNVWATDRVFLRGGIEVPFGVRPRFSLGGGITF